MDSKIGYAHFLEHMKFWIGDNHLYEEMKNLSIVLNATTSEKILILHFLCSIYVGGCFKNIIKVFEKP
ncbi:hypothetical protein J4714_04135 [Staphylococcus epidermidis]|nr:hypothetical protein [Staphylococcus epidermidis]